MSTKKQSAWEESSTSTESDACRVSSAGAKATHRLQPAAVVDVDLHHGALLETCMLLPNWVGCMARQPVTRMWCRAVAPAVKRAQVVQPCGVASYETSRCATVHTESEIALLLYPSTANELSLSLTDMDRNVLILKRIAGKAYRQLFGFADFDDLLQFAWLGLLEARSRFEAVAGVPFGAYAHRRVKGAIIDGMGRMTGMSRGRLRTLRNAVDPEGTAVLEPDADTSAATQGAPAVAQLSTPQGPACQPAESCVGLASLAEEERTWLLRAYETPTSWDKLCDQAVETSQLPMFGVPQTCPEEQAIRSQLLDRLWAVYQLMDPDDQALLRSLYFDEISTRELGERFQVSSASVSRRHLRIINHLRRCVGYPTRRAPCARRRRRQTSGA